MMLEIDTTLSIAASALKEMALENTNIVAVFAFVNGKVKTLLHSIDLGDQLQLFEDGDLILISKAHEKLSKI